MDSISPQKRSENMARIRSKDSKPELIVRSIIYSLGIRYRLHSTDLPGKPDIVVRKQKKAVFVHGCFWHQHSKCRDGRLPKSRQEYWTEKLENNIKRDQRVQLSLIEMGWSYIVIWECQTKSRCEIRENIKEFLLHSETT